MWQHLFWFFGHPEVHIIALPFFGILFETIPVFLRKPILGHQGLVFATTGITARHGEKVEVDDPGGFGGSFESTTSCPPPRHNFTSLPRIRSERPALDLRHPEVAAFPSQQFDADKPLVGGGGTRGS